MKDILLELTAFFFSKKTRIVLIPFLVVLILLSGLFLFASSSSWSPFIYAIF